MVPASFKKGRGRSHGNGRGDQGDNLNIMLEVVLEVLQEPTFNDANAVRTLVSPRKVPVPVVHMHTTTSMVCK